MYSVSTDYRNKIKSTERVFKLEVKIHHKLGTITLGDEHIAQGSFIYNDASQVGDEFTVGGTFGANIEFTLVNKHLYDGIDFMGAKVVPTLSLQIREGVDAHFMQPSQPSKMPNTGDDLYEDIPIGQFNIDVADRKRTSIVIKAIDNMILLDKPYTLSQLSYPASLSQIYLNICNVADVLPVMIGSFTNSDYMVTKKPSGDFTLRNILGFVAELSGSFAKFDRLGKLGLYWYEDVGVTITKHQRSNLEVSDSDIQITGIGVEVDEVLYLVGTDEYAIDLTGNELLQGGQETVLPNILARIETTKFRPYSASWHGDVAMQSGDKITHISVDGEVYDTIITHMQWKYRGSSKIEAKALSNISRGFNSTDGRIAQIIKKVDEVVGDRLTSIEEAQLDATELIGNMLGGYVTQIKSENDPYYQAKHGVGVFIHDAPLLSNSTKIWKWGIGGFGYSDNGGVLYTTGITANGSIVANLITAGIIRANDVQTGILQSNNGKVHFNLDNNTFNLGNVLTFDGTQLKLSSPDIPDEVDLSGVENDIANIKNLTTGTTIKGGTTTIDNTKVRVTHADGTYSEMNATGFFKQWANGRGDYLNDVEVIRGSSNTSEADGYLPNVYVNIPERFRGRQVKAFVLPIETTFSVGRMDRYGDILWIVDTPIVNYAKVTSIDTNTYMEARVLCGVEYEIAYNDGSNRQRYWLASFDLLLIGY